MPGKREGAKKKQITVFNDFYSEHFYASKIIVK